MASSTAPELPLANAILETKEQAHRAEPSRTDSVSSLSDTEKHAGNVVIGGHGVSQVTIDPVAESKLVRKQDFRILPALWIAYFVCFLDRSNLGNARVAGLERSLGLKIYDFNIGACLYFIIYFFADIPGGLIVKKFGFWVVPASTVGFGIITLCTAFIHNRGSFFTMRILLGLTESFTMPGCAYCLTRYYRRKELTVRISFFMVMAAATAQAFGGLLASGFLSAPVNSLGESWRSIFFGEGLITIGIGLTMFYWFPNDPAKTKIFNDAERKLSVERFFADQPAIKEHKEAITAGLIKKALTNPVMFVCTWLYICNNITVQGLAVFTPTILRSVYPGRTTVQIQLLSVPPPVVGLFFALTVSYVAMKTRKHALCIMFSISLAIIGYSLWITFLTTPKIRYAALFLTQMAGYAYGPIVLSWATANAAPDTVRAVTAAAVTGFGNVGSVVGTWSYIPTDAPSYKIGNTLNLATGSSVFVVAGLLMLWMMRENAARAAGKRDYRLEEKDVHLLGHDHPNFKYIT